MKPYYIVRYVQDCEGATFVANTAEEALKFVAAFKNDNDREGCWIGSVDKGFAIYDIMD